MEEIDIIELLKRVKEGKAPKRIEVNGNEYCFEENAQYGDYRRENKDTHIYLSNEFDIRGLSKLKIKILDKPIIEELGYELDLSVNGLIKPTEYEKRLGNCIIANAKKINEIIKHINKEEK